MALDPVRVGILVVSDRASRGEYEDRGGPAIRDEMGKILRNPWEERLVVIPDEQPEIEAALRRLCDDEGCSLVVTTGGTGSRAARRHARGDRERLRQDPRRLR